ncbi:MAG: hypothetical protein COX79_04540 [Candidatus Levybacteria bacterium CG_4_10_14_0_2_um_filter_36_16]|nr:MAG: hypothetical protein AUK12_03065 [Candidatus Levybacteria bacterium CG2_30_37_29]PIR79461.1 MAG: hypothetical protein COU26_01025 [Candidatus Levybacteria bacterium CG10_big_fil_rev_8_21_14_0_10_36_30]PIZ96702.1 MAG: hypothetical protein COX79_04540 [Candidatus Levybacteria bacterium CG_4_10_14_0_2_um_filter_36_16]
MGEEGEKQTPTEHPSLSDRAPELSKTRTPEEMVEIRKQWLAEAQEMFPQSKPDGTPFTDEEMDQLIEIRRDQMMNASLDLIRQLAAESAAQGEGLKNADPVVLERFMFLSSRLQDFEYRRMMEKEEEEKLPDVLKEIYKKNVFTGKGTLDHINTLLKKMLPRTKDASDQGGSTEDTPQTLEDAIIARVKEGREIGESEEATKEAIFRLGDKFSVSAEDVAKAADSETVKKAIYKLHGQEYGRTASAENTKVEKDTRNEVPDNETLKGSQNKTDYS